MINAEAKRQLKRNEDNHDTTKDKENTDIAHKRSVHSALTGPTYDQAAKSSTDRQKENKRDYSSK